MRWKWWKSGTHAVLVAALAGLGPLAFGQTPEESQGPALATVDRSITDFEDAAIGTAEGGLPDRHLHSLPPVSLRLEYLSWWLNGNPLPPLVTTGPVGAAPVFGAPGTRVLFGHDEVDASRRGGFRGTCNVRLAHWFETDWELEGQVIVMGHDQSSGDFFAESTGVPVIGRPFFNLQTSSQDVLAVAAPGLPFPDPVLGMPDPSLTVQVGRIRADLSSDLNGAGVLLRRPSVDCGMFSCELLAGYRYLRYQERLTLRQSQFFNDPTSVNRVGEIHIEDSFSTWSEFHGVDLGVETRRQYGPVELQLLVKLAVGNVHQILDVRGSSHAIRPEDNDPNTPQVVEQGYGFLATASTVGRHTANRFGVVPELGVMLRRPVGGCFSITLGYTLLALPNVLRTGDQIDTAIDPSQATAPTSPALRDSILWIQGINVGVEF